MSKFASIVLLMLLAAPATAQNMPDLRGTWKGEAEAIIWGKPMKHHPPVQQTDQARQLNNSLTLKIETQDGRRFAATLSSQYSSEKMVGIISRTGTIFMADDDGTDFATLLAPDRMELCHLHGSSETRLATCAELTRQP
jgi:hypothetical protein